MLLKKIKFNCLKKKIISKKNQNNIKLIVNNYNKNWIKSLKTMKNINKSIKKLINNKQLK